MWHSYEPRGNKVYQQQLIRWLRRWCAARHILRSPNETPVHSKNIRSDFVSDGNPIDGRGLLWLIRLQHFIYCIFISARLSCQKNHARKTRTRVQVAPAAIVCTGYDTVRHFASPINRTASLQIALVYCIPLWPFEPQEEWLWAFDSTLQKFTPVISFGSSSLRVAVRLFGGERRGVELLRARIRVDSLNLWPPFSVHHNAPSERVLAVRRHDISTNCSPFEFS